MKSKVLEIKRAVAILNHEYFIVGPHGFKGFKYDYDNEMYFFIIKEEVYTNRS